MSKLRVLFYRISAHGWCHGHAHRLKLRFLAGASQSRAGTTLLGAWSLEAVVAFCNHRYHAHQTRKDKYQLLKEEYLRTRDELRRARVIIDNRVCELRKRKEDLRKAYQCIGHLQKVSQRSKDSIGRS